MKDSYRQFFDYAEAFYRRKFFVIIPAIICAIAAAALSFKLPSHYKSSTLILVEHQQIPESYVRPTDKTPIDQRLNTIKQQILSRTKLEQIINDFGLYKDVRSDGSGGALTGIRKKLGLQTAVGVSNEEMIELMREDIEVKVMGGGSRGGDAFSISYIGKDPYVTMQVTNTLSSLFIEENLKIREQYAEGTAEFLGNELEKAKSELEKQEQALRKFKEEHMGSLPEQLQANLRTLDRLQLEFESVSTAIKNSEDRKAMLEEQLARVAAGARTITAGSTTVTIASPIEESIDKLKAELATMLSIYRENYPDVIIIKKRIAELESMRAENMKKMMAERAASAENDEPENNPNVANSELYSELKTVRIQIASFKNRLEEIRAQIREYERRVEEIPANEQKMTDIRRDYNISLQNYQNLLEKKLNARLAENLEKKQKGERFRVIDPANLPEKPFKPDKKKITSMGGIVGLGLGAGIVFLLEFLNPTFRKPDDFEDVLPYPVLGTIPSFDLNSGKTGK